MIDIAIAGGGIGGLASALFLHEQGEQPTVYEAARSIRELGVGINLQPHALRELSTIGLQDAVLQAGVSCDHWGLYNEYGQEVWSEPRGLAAGEHWPQVSIHRGTLQGILLAAVRERLGADRVQTDRRLGAFSQDRSMVQTSFTSVDGARTEVESDVLLGADGIHSQVRRQLFPDEGQVCFSGQNMWRGLVKARAYLGGHTMAIIGHDAQKFIAYPITPPDDEGFALINWIVELPTDRPLGREDWNRTAEVGDLAARFTHWRVPWLDVASLIAQTGVAYEFPMVDRDPLPRWTHNRVTLLGDAAHPMYPIGANGASQAIRDGAALSRAIAASGVAGLASYDDERRPLTRDIVLSNRKLGPEAVLELAHVRAPHGFDRIDDVIPRHELEAVARDYRTLTWASAPASHDAENSPV
ncbi:flavin-dependent oxidoreductase [Subtercola sp. YIM 133946]|uniref:flavin-dependent oxidoreductase n=1 Tax=Subtercola sp. YIM 133946 TaxID=3118909 RepID=UPI002F920AA2